MARLTRRELLIGGSAIVAAGALPEVQPPDVAAGVAAKPGW
jgi:hypothetical protein